MRYTNKFVEFLNGANTIMVKGLRDYNSLKSLAKKAGLDLIGDTYWGLLALAQRNRCAINNTSIIIEYQPCKGFTIGYRSCENSADWYGQMPWTMTEVINSMK